MAQVCAFDYLSSDQVSDIQAGALLMDVTLGVQAAIDAGANGGIYLPAGRYKISAPLAFDPSKSYRFYGDGYAVTNDDGTQIYNVGNCPAISVNNAGTTNFDPDISFDHFGIKGNFAGTAQKGFYARRTPVKLRSVYVANGYHGFHLERCYCAGMEDCISAQNRWHGIYLDREANRITLLRCAANGNARVGGGWAGIACVGTVGSENLGVTIIGCDTEGNGQVSGTGYGIVVQKTRGCLITGHYSEANQSGGFYSDGSASNVKLDSCYWQDEAIQADGVVSLTFTNNRVSEVSRLTSVVLSGLSGYPIIASGNVYGAGVTASIT